MKSREGKDLAKGVGEDGEMAMMLMEINVQRLVKRNGCDHHAIVRFDSSLPAFIISHLYWLLTGFFS